MHGVHKFSVSLPVFIEKSFVMLCFIFCVIFLTIYFILFQKGLKMPKEKTKPVNRGMTGNTIAKRTNNDLQKCIRVHPRFLVGFVLLDL